MTTALDRDADALAALEIRDLSFAYDRALVLENLSLQIEAGVSACFVGPNGGGKTTLFRLILGLIEPQGGQIRVFGEKPQDAAPRIGYVPQHMHVDLEFPIRVDDVVRMGCLGTSLPSRSRRDRVGDALRAVELEDCRGRWFRNLSGGQRQRVLIARALATEPQLLLLDEPTASVDAVGRKTIIDLLGVLRSRMTIYVITHDTSLISLFLDRIICVDRGIHVHPPTNKIDDHLLRHILGHTEAG